MDIERLAYLSLNEILKQPGEKGSLKVMFQNLGIDLPVRKIDDVTKYIEKEGLAKVIEVSSGRMQIFGNSYTQSFVQMHKVITLEDKMKLVCSELRGRPERKGDLENILHDLRIDYTIHDLPDFLEYFKATGFVRNLTERSKDGATLYLTDRGIDFLNGKHSGPAFIPSTTIYNVSGGQIAAMGTNATAYDNNFNQVNQLPADFDYNALLQELSQLRIALVSSSDREHHMIISEVVQAEVAAETQNGNKVIEHLKRGGKLLWSFSENVGANIVANIFAKFMEQGNIPGM